MESVRLPHPDAGATKRSSIPITLNGPARAESHFVVLAPCWLCVNLGVTCSGTHGVTCGSWCAWIAPPLNKGMSDIPTAHEFSTVCLNLEWTSPALKGCKHRYIAEGQAQWFLPHLWSVWLCPRSTAGLVFENSAVRRSLTLASSGVGGPGVHYE